MNIAVISWGVLILDKCVVVESIFEYFVFFYCDPG